MTRFQEEFLKRNFSRLLQPMLLVMVVLVTAPFIFSTDPRESLVALTGTFKDLHVVQHADDHDNTFRFGLKEYPRTFVIAGMRVPVQIGFTSHERNGNEARLSVLKQDLENPPEGGVPVQGLATDSAIYLVPENYGVVMRTNRAVAAFVTLCALGGALLLARRLRATYRKELADSVQGGYDDYVIWLAANPDFFVRCALVVCFLVASATFPRGTWHFTLVFCASAYATFHVWFRRTGHKMPWIQEALRFEADRVAAKPRVQTSAPTFMKKLAALLKKSAGDINCLNEKGRSPLHDAAARGSTEEVNYLLSHGAEIDLPDRKGATALMLAVDSGDVIVIKKLLAARADALYQTVDGESALSRAKKNPKYSGIVEILEQAEAAARSHALEQANSATVEDIVAKITKSGRDNRDPE